MGQQKSQRKHLLSGWWGPLPWHCPQSSSLVAGSWLSSLYVLVLPLEHHLRSTAEGSLLQDEQKHQHNLAHSWFHVSSVENLLQISLVTNAYTRLGQTNIKSSSGNFLWGLKNNYEPKFANCMLRGDLLPAKIAHSSVNTALPMPMVKVFLSVWWILCLAWQKKKNSSSECIFLAGKSSNSLAAEFTHWQRNSAQVVQNLW